MSSLIDTKPDNYLSSRLGIEAYLTAECVHEGEEENLLYYDHRTIFPHLTTWKI